MWRQVLSFGQLILLLGEENRTHDLRSDVHSMLIAGVDTTLLFASFLDQARRSSDGISTFGNVGLRRTHFEGHPVVEAGFLGLVLIVKIARGRNVSILGC